MSKILLGVLFGLLAGAFCRKTNIPAPAPPTMIGALMVFAVSCGYYLTDRVMVRNVKSQMLSHEKAAANKIP